jgi:hypothetical protein
MDIKPPSSKKPSLDPATNQKTDAAEKSGKFQGRMKTESSVNATPSSTAAATLEKLKGRFSKRDLEDGTKVETIINSAIDEVLLSGPESLRLPAGGRRAVADLMNNDPLIREKMMNLLRKTLE